MKKRREEGSRLVVSRDAVKCVLAVILCAGIVPVDAYAVQGWDDKPDAEPAINAAGGERDATFSDGGDAIPSASPDGAQLRDGGDAPRDGEFAESKRQAIERLESLRASLDAKLDELALARAEFADEHLAMPRELFARDAASGTRGGPEARADELAQFRKKAICLLRAVQDELQRSDEYGAHAILSGMATSGELELRQDMLERLMVAENARIREVLGEQRRLRVNIAIDAANAFRERRELRNAARSLNTAAYEVERHCAQARQCVSDLRAAVFAVQGDDAQIAEACNAGLDAAGSATSAIEEAERAIGSWYDDLDARASATGAISFGEGIDFSLPEDAFVDTWGAAIDAFFTAGATPLQGYGRCIAAAAYRHKVDPRLCAAVSIVESSGGKDCIRPHNAWGWGAADADPYGLAAEWDSFEEAIEAWHVGMAASANGLATAPTVSALGAIYCSSPTWGAGVIEQMELISGFA